MFKSGSVPPESAIRASGWRPWHFRLAGAGRVRARPGQRVIEFPESAGHVPAAWILTLRGVAHFKAGAQRWVLDAGRALVVVDRPGSLIEVPRSGEVWDGVWMVAQPGPALEAFQFLRQRFGSLQSLPERSRASRFAMKFAEHVAARLERPAGFWALLAFEWMQEWWEAVEQRGRPAAGRLPGQPDQLLDRSHQTIQHFSHEIGYSPSHLSRKLREAWGEPPGAALRNARLKQAAKMLRETQLAAADVAEKTGYHSPSAFSRAFRKAFGCTPVEYRDGKEPVIAKRAGKRAASGRNTGRRRG